MSNKNRTIITLAMFIFLGTMAYLTEPYFSIPNLIGETTKHWTQPPGEIGVVLLIGSTFGLLVTITIGTILDRKLLTKNWAIIPIHIAACIVILYICLPILTNTFSWMGTKPTTVAIETIKEKATPEEAAAGRAYLQAIQKSTDPSTFQKEVEPLLAQEKWAFIGDDPSLYQIDGMQGSSENTSPNWMYTIPIGNAQKNIVGNLELAGQYANDGQTYIAAQKVAFVLGTGNRISDHPQFITALIGQNFIKKAIEFLENHPEISQDPRVQKELKRSLNLPEKLQFAWEEELKQQQKWIELMATPNNKMTVGAGLFNANFWGEISKELINLQKTNKPDWEQFIKSQRNRAYLTGQPLQAIFIQLAVPAANYKEEITPKIKKLLQS